MLNGNEKNTEIDNLKLSKQAVIFSDNFFKDTLSPIQSAKNSFDVRSYTEVIEQVTKIDKQVSKLLRKNNLD